MTFPKEWNNRMRIENVRGRLVVADSKAKIRGYGGSRPCVADEWVGGPGQGHFGLAGGVRSKLTLE